jgi:hypothetical protein
MAVLLRLVTAAFGTTQTSQDVRIDRGVLEGKLDHRHDLPPMAMHIGGAVSRLRKKSSI